MITLYSTDCPKCKVLKKKLDTKGIEYTEVTDIEAIRKKGYAVVPILVVEDREMDFKSANEWLNNN